MFNSLVSAEKGGENGHDDQAEGLKRDDSEGSVAVIGIASAVLGVDAQEGGLLALVLLVAGQE